MIINWPEVEKNTAFAIYTCTVLTYIFIYSSSRNTHLRILLLEACTFPLYVTQDVGQFGDQVIKLQTLSEADVKAMPTVGVLRLERLLVLLQSTGFNGERKG